MEAFLVLSEELHFGRTAERLGVSAGRVSQTIGKLERRVGCLLFERSSRRVALTPVGRRLAEDLGPAYRQMQQAWASAVAAGRGFADGLRIGYSSPMTADLILRAAEVFRGSYPDCEVVIQETQLADPFGPLRAGRLHFQVTETPVRESDLTVGPVLVTERPMLVVPARHELARRVSVTVEDLAGTTLVTFAGMPQYWIDHHYPTVTPSGAPIHRVTATYWQEALALVGAGKGCTIASQGAEPYYTRPDTVWVPFRGTPPIEYAAVLRRTAVDERAVQAFTEVLVRTGGLRRHASPGVTRPGA
ncbi:LysR family transcriptional regulator [Embleya sp. NPDC020630]|uniref:LysR family transcriptional regulator n=1 Tax=Embleya sp. NPDC020630 TaxID=3363979 RepID=UPI0037A40494